MSPGKANTGPADSCRESCLSCAIISTEDTLLPHTRQRKQWEGEHLESQESASAVSPPAPRRGQRDCGHEGVSLDSPASPLTPHPPSFFLKISIHVRISLNISKSLIPPHLSFSLPREISTRSALRALLVFLSIFQSRVFMLFPDLCIQVLFKDLLLWKMKI